MTIGKSLSNLTFPVQSRIFRLLILCLALGLTGLSADIHAARTWTFKNGDQIKLEFANAYGGKAYFHKGNEIGSADIFSLSEEDQAEIILWSRKRDRELLSGAAELSDFTRRFRKDAKSLVDGKLVDPDWSNTREPDFYAVYTSASWCGPCRSFTPRLVQFYDSYKRMYGDRLEFILCSWDRSIGDMIDYMEEEHMAWYGNWRKRDSSFWRKLQGSGIPCLVILDRNGNMLCHSYDGDDYLGPTKPMELLRELLLYASDDPGNRISVPTPGIDMAKLSEAIRKKEQTAEQNEENFPPQPVFTTMGLLGQVDDPEAEETLLQVKLSIDARGNVREASILDPVSRELDEVVRKSLVLWHFMPQITAGKGAIATEVILPLSIRIQDRFLIPSKDLAGS